MNRLPIISIKCVMVIKPPYAAFHKGIHCLSIPVHKMVNSSLPKNICLQTTFFTVVCCIPDPHQIG